ncbi:hypothetical protein P8452_48147 [Trifolium repens]|nr:hypothetical protein P8452_48147 [Trifolium repens]
MILFLSLFLLETGYCTNRYIECVDDAACYEVIKCKPNWPLASSSLVARKLREDICYLVLDLFYLFSLRSSHTLESPKQCIVATHLISIAVHSPSNTQMNPMLL